MYTVYMCACTSILYLLTFLCGDTRLQELTQSQYLLAVFHLVRQPEIQKMMLGTFHFLASSLQYSILRLNLQYKEFANRVPTCLPAASTEDFLQYQTFPVRRSLSLLNGTSW